MARPKRLKTRCQGEYLVRAENCNSILVLQLGPASIYKKQFNKLMEMLKSKSKNIVIQENKNQQKLEKDTFVKGLVAIGIIQLIVGVLGIISASAFIIFIS